MGEQDSHEMSAVALEITHLQESRFESVRAAKKSWFAMARRKSCDWPMREIIGSIAARLRWSLRSACEWRVTPAAGSE